MRMPARTGLLALGVMLLGGCSIAGTWKTVKVSPESEGKSFPIQMVTFTPDGDYSATEQRGDQTMTSSGKYKWDGMNLTVMPTGGSERVYPGCMCLITNRLVLKHKMEGKTMSAEMEKQKEMEN